MWTTFEVFIDFIKILLRFYVSVFGREAWDLSFHPQELNLHPLHWEGES